MATGQRDTVLDRLLDPVSECLTPDVARRLVELRASADLQTRLDELADKNSDGDLTATEREEYETYVLAGRFISILQAKARRQLRENPSA